MKFVFATLIFCVLTLSLTGPLPRAWANGWEHSAIPFQVLLDALEGDDLETRRRAAQSLGIRGNQEAVPALLAQVSQAENKHDYRQTLLEALGRLADPRATGVLESCLATEAREEIRATCALSLGQIAHPTSLPLVIERGLSDSSLLVQIRVVEALANFAEHRATETLIAILADKNRRALWSRAVRALGQSGSSKAVPALLTVLRQPSTSQLESEAIQALALLAPEEAAKPLLERMESAKDPRLRHQIAVALGAIRKGSLKPHLIELLNDPSPAVQLAAIQGLKYLRASDSAQPIAVLAQRLLKELADQEDLQLAHHYPENLVRLSLLIEALRALSELEPRQGFQVFQLAAAPRPLPKDHSIWLKLSEGFYEVRRLALFGLGYTERDEARTTLTGPAGLTAPDHRLRMTAARSLGVLGGEASVKPLIAAASDPKPDVRRVVIRVLGLLADNSALPVLIQSLSDDSSWVRREAAQGLGYIGEISALPALENSRDEDENPGVKAAAEQAISRLSEAN